MRRPVDRQQAAEQEHVPRRLTRGRATAEAARGEEHHRLLELQRSAGNAAVANALSVSRAPAPEPELSGIGANFAVDQYAAVAQKLRENWARLQPTDRAQMLVTAVNFELAHVDVPSATFELSDKLQPQTAGEFVADKDKDDWAFLLNRTQFRAPSPDAIDQQGEGNPGLAQIVYHEGRHAEQTFRVARLKAGMKWKAKVIADWLSIPARIAKEAVKHPLKGDGPEAREAEAWLGGKTGSQGEETAKSYGRLDEVQKKLSAAEAAQKKLEADPNASEADKKKAAALVDLWQKRFDEARAAYLKIPEEADAWKVGGRAESALGKAKK
jgi:hypothetical protein